MWSNATPDTPIVDQLWQSCTFEVSWKLWDISWPHWAWRSPLGKHDAEVYTSETKGPHSWQWDEVLCTRYHVQVALLPMWDKQVLWPMTQWAMTCSRIKWLCQLGTGRAYVGCHYPMDNVKVLDHHQDIHHRLSLESIHIKSQPKPLMRDNGSMPQVYNSLVQPNYVTVLFHSHHTTQHNFLLKLNYVSCHFCLVSLFTAC